MFMSLCLILAIGLLYTVLCGRLQKEENYEMVIQNEHKDFLIKKKTKRGSGQMIHGLRECEIKEK